MSKKLAFTKRIVSALVHDGPGKSTEFSDSTTIGLKLEVYPSSRKIWFFRYTFEGRKRAVRIGEYPAIDLDEARSTAYQHRADVDRGINPADEKRARREELTFRQYADDVYIPHAQVHKKSAKDDIAKLHLHIYKVFGDRKLSAVTKQEISTYHGQVKQSHSPAYANRHLALIKRMLGLAVEWGYLTANAAHGIKLFREENCRETFLSKDEAKRLVDAMASDSNPIACAALKIMLLTGVRRQEALSARWVNVDLDAGIWLLPNTKARKPRQVVLSDAAQQVLHHLQASAINSPYVFPGRDPTKPLCDPKKTLRRLLAAAGITKPFRIHDTRHSFASLLIADGTPLYTVQKLLGHAQSSTTERYAHLSQGNLRAGVEAIGQMLG
ncbi:tyrosine-type recombinase/integrase [Paraburkholderia bryophila]|uniref:Integrase n=1 Tax=Paraburkholderia bryophila TaxID=420952 RepID=A0A7Y9WLG8_9BURK|nr:site-specific integrase [Paraburkholderia bryophila]NYH22470.1 integrase [Paraburkholderia bryophila]